MLLEGGVNQEDGSDAQQNLTEQFLNRLAMISLWFSGHDLFSSKDYNLSLTLESMEFTLK